VPILQVLISSGMGKGPALSLPSMLVIRGVMGTKKTLTYIGLVVIMATVTGMVFGGMF
jgi:uncharacterized membrane protein YraQ (UPF0718 family)